MRRINRAAKFQRFPLRSEPMYKQRSSSNSHRIAASEKLDGSENNASTNTKDRPREFLTSGLNAIRNIALGHCLDNSRTAARSVSLKIRGTVGRCPMGQC